MRASAAILVLALTGLLWFPVSRGSGTPLPQVYVRNRPFSGNILVSKQGKLYAELNPLLRLLGDLPSKKQVVVLEAAGRTVKISVEGRPFQPWLIRNGKLLVRLDVFSRALGLNFSYNPATRIADITLPPALFPPRLPSAPREGFAETGQEALPLAVTRDPRVETEKYKEYDEVNHLPITRAYVVVENLTELELDAATLRCDFQDSIGKLLHQDTQVVSNLTPRESRPMVFVLGGIYRPGRLYYRIYLLDWKPKGKERRSNPDSGKPVFEAHKD